MTKRTGIKAIVRIAAIEAKRVDNECVIVRDMAMRYCGFAHADGVFRVVGTKAMVVRQISNRLLGAVGKPTLDRRSMIAAVKALRIWSLTD